MRDLDFNELQHVYGASGKSCSPTPPSCPSTKGSKSKGSNAKGSKAKSSKSKGHCYC